jgi:hypothetical protein
MSWQVILGVVVISREETPAFHPTNVAADGALAYSLFAALHGGRGDVMLTAVNL